MKTTFTLDAALRLANITSQLKNELQRNYTIPNPAYIEARKQGRYTGNLDENLFFWQQDGDDIILPRGAAREVYQVARQHGEITVIDNVLPRASSRSFSITWIQKFPCLPIKPGNGRRSMPRCKQSICQSR